MSISDQIIHLYNGKNYLALKAYYSRSSLFDILGISRWETVHSNFLAWILNPNASHKMGYEPLRKFIRLLYLASNTQTNTTNNFAQEMKVPVITDTYRLEDVNVVNEQATPSRARMDIYIKGGIQLNPESSEQRRTLQIIIENKIDSSEHNFQTQKYYNSCVEQQNEDKRDIILAAYLTPDISNKCSDERYLRITYQQLADEVLFPLNNVQKSPMASFLIDEYLRNLGRAPFQNESTKKKRTIMAIEPYEKELIREFYESNQDLIMAIVNVLANDEDVQLDEKQRESLKSINAGTFSNRDSNNYKYNGTLYTAHTELVRQVFKDYAKMNPMTLSDFCNRWELKSSHYLSREDYDTKEKSGALCWPFNKKVIESDWITFKDTSMIISSNWPLKVNSADADFSAFLKKANELGIILDAIAKNNK